MIADGAGAVYIAVRDSYQPRVQQLCIYPRVMLAQMSNSDNSYSLYRIHAATLLSCLMLLTLLLIYIIPGFRYSVAHHSD